MLSKKLPCCSWWVLEPALSSGLAQSCGSQHPRRSGSGTCLSGDAGDSFPLLCPFFGKKIQFDPWGTQWIVCKAGNSSWGLSFLLLQDSFNYAVKTWTSLLLKMTFSEAWSIVLAEEGCPSGSGTLWDEKRRKKAKKKKRFFLFPVATFVYISVEVIWGQMCKSMGCLRMQSYQPHRVLWGLVEMQFSIDNCSWWRQGTVKGHRRTLLASVSGISWETTMQNGHAASCQPLLGQLVKTQVTQRSTRQCIWKGRA